MKILLIQLRWPQNTPPIYPIAVSRLCASLSGQASPIALDLNCVQHQGSTVQRILEAETPDMIGISFRNVDSIEYEDLFLSNTPLAFVSPLESLRSTVDAVRQWCSDVPIVVGGPAFTLFPETIMSKIPQIDIGITGEGEETIVELVSTIGEPDKVRGIWLRRDGQVAFTGDRPPICLEQMSMPDFNAFDTSLYSESRFAFGIESKRGCVLHCAYCNYPFLSGRSIRIRDPKGVVDEIQEWTRRFGIRSFHFTDSVFNMPKTHAEAICHEILRRHLDIEWKAFFAIVPFDESFANLAVRAGCRLFEFSPDFMDNHVLSKMHKKYTDKDIFRTLTIAKRIAGMTVMYNFMVNAPGESLGSFARTIVFGMRLKRQLGSRGLMGTLNHIRIFPWTPIRRLAVTQGVLTDETDLLPETPESVKAIFYVQPRSFLVEGLYRIFIWLRRAIKSIRAAYGRHDR